jgi:hypothetical protein
MTYRSEEMNSDKNITFFGHYPSSYFCLKRRHIYFSKHNVSETGFCPETGTSSIDWSQMSSSYLRTETECCPRNVVF